MTFAEAFVAARRLRCSIARTTQAINLKSEQLRKNFAIAHYLQLHSRLVRDREDKAADLLSEVISDMKKTQ